MYALVKIFLRAGIKSNKIKSKLIRKTMFTRVFVSSVSCLLHRNYLRIVSRKQNDQSPEISKNMSV